VKGVSGVHHRRSGPAGVVERLGRSGNCSAGRVAWPIRPPRTRTSWQSPQSRTAAGPRSRWGRRSAAG